MFKSIENIDVVINNAAVVEPHNLNKLKYEEWVDVWRRTIDTNLIGSAHIMFFSSRAMKKSGGGKFINISSRGAFRGEPSAPAYGASKAGLNSLGQSMAVALAKDNIFVFDGWNQIDKRTALGYKNIKYMNLGFYSGKVD